MYANHYYNPYGTITPNGAIVGPQTLPPMTPVDPRIWVQGEAGMKAFLVAPGNTVELWDSESQTIWLKNADAAGRPTVQTIEYKYREEPVVQNTAAAYVPMEDFRRLEARLEEIEKGLRSNV